MVFTWYVLEVCTETKHGMYMVCTWYVLDMYLVCTRSMYQDKRGMYLVLCTWYERVYTRKRKKIAWHNVGNRTQYLMHTILHVIPLRHQRAFLGDMDG
jgi:hypothetical protein